MTENDIQRQCVGWFRTQYPKCIIAHHRNEGTANPRQVNAWKSLGYVPGIADIECVFPGGRLLYIELKTPKGKVRDTQIAFSQKCEAIGIPYHVVRGLDEFITIVKEFANEEDRTDRG